MRSRVAPTSPRSSLSGSEPRDDLAEVLRGVGRSGPAAGARSDRGRGLPSEAPADQLGLERGIGETLHGAFEDEPGRLGVLDIGDLVDLPRRLAVAAGPLVGIGDGLARAPGRARGSSCAGALLGRDVGQAGPDAIRPGLEARELGAHLETLAERRCDLGKDRGRDASPGNTPSARLPGILAPAEAARGGWLAGRRLDQLALEFGDQLIEIRRRRESR